MVTSKVDSFLNNFDGCVCWDFVTYTRCGALLSATWICSLCLRKIDVSIIEPCWSMTSGKEREVNTKYHGKKLPLRLTVLKVQVTAQCYEDQRFVTSLSRGWLETNDDRLPFHWTSSHQSVSFSIWTYCLGIKNQTCCSRKQEQHTTLKPFVPRSRLTAFLAT